jgi:hypothetical protein
MNDQIIDTQDGDCIWQTVGKLADGRQHACVRPVSEGVMTHGVFLMHEDGDIEWFSIHPSLDSAVPTLLGYTGDLTAFSAPLESGKFP